MRGHEKEPNYKHYSVKQHDMNSEMKDNKFNHMKILERVQDCIKGLGNSVLRGIMS